MCVSVWRCDADWNEVRVGSDTKRRASIACRSVVYVVEERVPNEMSLEHIGDFVVFAYRLCEEELTSIGTLETQERVCLASLGEAQ